MEQELVDAKTMSKDDVIAELEARGMAFNRKDTKDKLINLLFNGGNVSGNTVTKMADVKYVCNPANGRVYEATERLLKNGDLIPATAEQVSAYLGE